MLTWQRNLAQVEFSLSNGGYISLTHSFSAIPENITVSHILPKTRFFGLHFCSRQYASNFNHFDVARPKATKFGEIVKITAITLFKVIRGHHFWHQLSYNLSCTVSKISQTTGQIFADDRGCLSLMHSFRVNP